MAVQLFKKHLSRLPRSCVAAWAISLVALPASAQTTQGPTISAVLPMGGQAGTTLDVKVTGQNLDKVEGLHFDFPGATVEVLGNEKAAAPPPGKKRGGMQAGAQLTQIFKLTLPKDVPPGIHDLRVVTKGGLSNPRAFVVGDHKEVLEEEPNDDVGKAQRLPLDSTVDGVIATPTDVDYFVFTGKKGQRILCSLLSSSIDSKLPAAVQLYSAAGVYLGIARGYQGNDALLDATLPADGDYHLRVFSFSYTLGGPDYFYRLTVSQAPWIDAVYPPIVEPGKEASVTIYGRNLPGGKLDPEALCDGKPLEKVLVTLKAPAGPVAEQRLAYSGLVLPLASLLDGFEYRLKNEHGVSNPVLVTYARAPVVLDNGKNDTQETAQVVAVPCEIAGRIEKKGDRDWYAFTAKKGEVYSIEARAERLGSPMDLQFALRDSKGATITDQDDSPDIMSPQFYTRTDDPTRYRFVVPADGTYQLMVASRDSFTLAGPRQLYTVRITPEQPDFRLVAMPTSLIAPEAPVLGQTGTLGFNVHVWRQDGFTGDITLTGENLPPGVSVVPQVLSPNQKQALVVVSAGPAAAPWAGALRLVGTAEVKGRKLVREVRAASITWPVPQQNIPAISRLDRELAFAVRGKAPYSLTTVSSKISALQGERVTIPVELQALEAEFKANVQVAVVGLPTGVNVPPLSLTTGKGGDVVIDTKAAFPPGNYTLLIKGQTQPATGKPPVKGAPANLVEYAPPVTLTVVPKQLGKIIVTPAPAKIQVGKQTELFIRVARQTELPLDFKVEVVFPSNAAGLSATAATIRPDQDGVKVTITANSQVMVGIAPNLTIRATALFNGTVPVVHEATVSLAVVK